MIWMQRLEDESRCLKARVADLSFDKHMLAEALRKKSCGQRSAVTSPTG